MNVWHLEEEEETVEYELGRLVRDEQLAISDFFSLEEKGENGSSSFFLSQIKLNNIIESHKIVIEID